MSNLAQKVKETIELGNYYIQAQFCHPERVKGSALEHAENTAEEYLSNITDEVIKKYTDKSIDELGDETNVGRILTDIADENCDHGGHETITCVVFPI
jgi:ribosomal protein L16/L10AE